LQLPSLTRDTRPFSAFRLVRHCDRLAEMRDRLLEGRAAQSLIAGLAPPLGDAARFARGGRCASRDRNDALVRRRVRESARSSGTGARAAGRDDGLAFRLGTDEGVQAMLYLALTLWQLGEIDRSVSLVRRRQCADPWRRPRRRVRNGNRARGHF
jgi:hypothetical protein